jgi:hypothetical protein
MASRYHWISSSMGVSFTGSTTFPVCDLAFPAGAQLKRFIVCNNLFFGTASGSNLNYAQPLTLYQKFQFIGGVNDLRVPYETFRALHCDYLTLFDSSLVFNNRIYTTILNAGDESLLINQKSTYGKATEPAYTLRLSGTLSCRGASPTLFSGSAGYTFKALYYL